MEIRSTEIKDLPLVMEIYDYARAFMRATGNTTQWIDGYPSEALIRREIEESHSFACIDEQGEILGTFCFILVSEACLDWCFERWPNVRVDTHRDNKVMQHILTKYGFQRCGIIYVKNGTERIAYQMERLHGGVEESDRTEV